MLAPMTRRRSRRYLAGAAAAVLALLAGCTSPDAKGTAATSSPAGSRPAPSPSASVFDLAGTLTIRGPYSTGVDAMTAGAPCLGISNQGANYEDIASGSPLEVIDNAGATAGVGTLGAGVMTVAELASRECVFEIRVTGIVAGKGFYALRIGNHTTEQMPEADFRAGPSFTLSGS